MNNKLIDGISELRAESLPEDKLIKGKEIAGKIREFFIPFMKEGNSPTLAVINSGIDPASNYYVNSQKKIFSKYGLTVEEVSISPRISFEELRDVINGLNENPDIDGIQVQVPLPGHLPLQKVLDLISPAKDVDCQSTASLGKLMTDHDIWFYPNTAFASWLILSYYSIDLTGLKTVILNRSTVVGKPLSMMLLKKRSDANATVTVCHSRTENLSAVLSEADVLVTAVGRPFYVKPEMVKEGAYVIDVGINSVEIEGKNKIVGDADFEYVYPKAGLITPVPGGVGSITTALLMYQVVLASHLK